jgi:hypothetical protein
LVGFFIIIPNKRYVIKGKIRKIGVIVESGVWKNKLGGVSC